MDAVAELLKKLVGIAWGPPLIILLIAAGFYFTIRNRGIQFTAFGHAIKVLRGKYDDPNDPGAINHFQALAAALSATVGLGNIAGVAVAVGIGGPGAVFWMWVLGFIGMATKFTTCTLAVMYRETDGDKVRGGPMYFIEKGLGPSWKPMATIFSVFCVIATFGGGNMFQSNQVAEMLGHNYKVPVELTGVVLAFGVGLVIIGGIKRIGRVAGVLAPVMCLIYVSGAVVVIIMNLGELPRLFALIFTNAFVGDSALGAGVGTVITWGVKRAVFSNEAGIGSAPIAHAAAKTTEPVREGLVAMLGPFIDTVVVCTATAMVILISGEYLNYAEYAKGEMVGVMLTGKAFDKTLPYFGKYIVTMGVVLFAFSTMISWSYYGEKCAEHLMGEKAVFPYKVIYCVCIMAGALWNFGPILDFSDIMYALMAVPNIIAAFLLSKKVSEATRIYFERYGDD